MFGRTGAEALCNGGENVGLSIVKDLITAAHNQSEIGLFITLAEPLQR